MGPVPIALLLVAAVGLAFALSRYVERRRGEELGVLTLVAAVAVPFALFVIPPALDEEEKSVAAVSPPCRIVSSSTASESRYETRPRRCRPSGGRSQGYRLVEGEVRFADGRETRPASKGLTGHVDSSEVVDDHPRISGWAANLNEGRPADSILFFSGGRFIGAVKLTVHRPDVASRNGRPGLRVSGYGVELPAAVGEAGSLRIFAVEGGAVSPVSLDCSNERLKFGC